MTEWTDLDYAQAAIDMLPGTVEEIEEFLERQGIKNKRVYLRSSTCPIAQWVQRWTGNPASYVAWHYVEVGGEQMQLPDPVSDYILYADRQVS